MLYWESLLKRWNNEKIVYEKYVPKQLTESELTLVIEEIINIKELSKPQDIGIVMSGLKSKYTGLYDGRMASTITRNMLAS